MIYGTIAAILLVLTFVVYKLSFINEKFKTIHSDIKRLRSTIINLSDVRKVDVNRLSDFDKEYQDISYSIKKIENEVLGKDFNSYAPLTDEKSLRWLLSEIINYLNEQTKLKKI